MKFEFHIYVHDGADQSARLGKIEASITKGFKDMADDFSGLEKAQSDNAAATTAAIDELKVLFQQVAQTPPSNQAEIDALTAKFNASTEALKAGIVAPTA